MSVFDDDDETVNAVPTSPFSELDEREEAPAPEAAPAPPRVTDTAANYANSSQPTELDEESPQATSNQEENWLRPIPVPDPVTLAPYKDQSQSLDALKAQYQKESTENVKPSGWRRFAAGLAGGAVTFGSRNPYAGAKVAEDINNAPRAAAETRWAREERPLAQAVQNDASANAQIQRENTGRIQQGNEADRNYRNQVYGQGQRARAIDFAAQAEARKNAPVAYTPNDPSNPYAGGTVKTADGRLIKDQPPPDKWLQNWERDPRNKAHAEALKGVQTLREMEQNGIKLTPEQRAIVASGGKVTPAVRTTISIRENPDGTPVTPKSQAMTQAQRTVILQQKNTAMAKAQDSLAQGLMKPEEALAQMQAAQDSFEQKIGVDTNGPGHRRINPDFSWSDGNGQNLGKSEPNADGGQPQAKPAQQAKQAAAPQAVKVSSGQTVKVGDPVKLPDGSTGIVTGINPQSGKPIVRRQ